MKNRDKRLVNLLLKQKKARSMQCFVIIAGASQASLFPIFIDVFQNNPTFDQPNVLLYSNPPSSLKSREF